MSSSKTLYVRDSDTKNWEDAERRAEREGQSLSAVIARLLGRYTAPGPERVRLSGPKLPQWLLVVDRDLANDQDYDAGATTVDPSTANLEWHRDAWKLWYVMPNGDVNDRLVAGSSASTESAVEAAVKHLTTLAEPGAADNEIVVDMRDDEGREWQTGFRGRWLIEPDDDNRYSNDAGACYGIAQTVKGKIAVYCYHVNDMWPPVLTVHDDLDEAQEEHGLADDAIAAAASDLGEKRVVWRDI